MKRNPCQEKVNRFSKCPRRVGRTWVGVQRGTEMAKRKKPETGGSETGKKTTNRGDKPL